MTPAQGAYRALVRLYPRAFRARYGEDLVQHFADLVTDHGPSVAWRRAVVDLVATVPRYRLEAIVRPDNSFNAVAILIALLAAAGVASMLVGLYPGLALILVAGGLAAAQRTSLARAIRALDPDLRHRRFVNAAVSGVVFAASFTIYLLVIGDHWTVRETALSVIGTTAMFVAIGFLVAGLLTPRAGRRPVAPTRS